MAYAIMYVQVSQYCILSLPMERRDSYLELPRKKNIYIYTQTMRIEMNIVKEQVLYIKSIFPDLVRSL